MAKIEESEESSEEYDDNGDTEYIVESEEDTEDIEDASEDASEEDTEDIDEIAKKLVYDNTIYDEYGRKVHESNASKVNEVNEVNDVGAVNNIINNYNNFNKLQDEYDEKNDNMVYLILNPKKNIRKIPSVNLKKHPINKKVYKFYNRYNSDEKKYFDILPESDKMNLVNIEEQIDSSSIVTDVPIRFKILNSSINTHTKKSIVSKI